MANKTKLISLKMVCERTSLSRTYINRLRGTDKFPTPVFVSERRIAFIEEEIDDWVANRISSRSEKQA